MTIAKTNTTKITQCHIFIFILLLTTYYCLKKRGFGEETSSSILFKSLL